MEKDRKPRNKPCTCGQLMYDKGGKTTQCWKDSLFKNWCWENWTATSNKTKLDHSLAPHKNKFKTD